jgi:DNA invertase Pin-like site-specific DNA recombinase
VIAKLDRLARNVHFVSGLIESGVEFVAADMPQANKVMLQMHAVMSEWERDQISARTKAALAAAKARGVILGRAGPSNLRRNIEERQEAANEAAARIAPTVRALLAAGMTLQAASDEMNRLGSRAPRGGIWTRQQIARVLGRA